MSRAARRHALLALSLVLLTAGSTGCSGYLRSKSLAEAAVATFYEKFDAEDYESIADSVHPAFFEGTPREELIDVLASTRSVRGSINESRQTSWNVNMSRGTTEVRLAYESTFEHMESQEQFRILVEQGKARVIHVWFN